MAKKKLSQEILDKRMDLLELKFQELKCIEPDFLLLRLNKIESMLYEAKEMLTTKEAADFMGISVSMLYKFTCRQEIPYYKPRGKMVYFDRQELQEWMRKNHYGGENNEAKAI